MNKWGSPKSFMFTQNKHNYKNKKNAKLEKINSSPIPIMMIKVFDNSSGEEWFFFLWKYYEERFQICGLEGVGT